jgi:hypothetical protein
MSEAWKRFQDLDSKAGWRVRKMKVTETERPEVFWVDALPKHVVDAMNGKDVEARFRDAITQDWTSVRKLKGWSKSGFDDVFYDGSSAWIFCQVYEPQSWWFERPDPGPGFRLLEKFPDEELKPGDECFSSTGKWDQSHKATIGGRQSYGMWYRRRIEAVEPKFSVGQTVRVIGPKGSDARHWSDKMNQHIGKTSPIKAREKKDDGWFYEISCSVVWHFREDYLEAVEPVEHYLGKVEAIKQFIVGDTFWHPNGLQLKVTEKGFEVC